MDALRPFTEHPASVGETYGEHFGTAVWFGGPHDPRRLCLPGARLLPFIFVHTGSRAITELNERMVAKRRRRPPAADRRATSRLPL